MTLEKLNEYLALLERIYEAEELLRSLRERAAPGAQVITGMPGGGGPYDRVGNLAAEIADTSSRLDALKEEAVRKRTEIVAYIDTVQDIKVATILRLRYLRGLAWQEVAYVMGGFRSASSVKNVLYRHFGE